MSGETNLSALLAHMRPVLKETTYVFCTTTKPPQDWLSFEPIATFVESEGTTLILTKEAAKLGGFDCTILMCCITLQVHSSLEAVGLTAAVAKALTEHNISANVVAAFYHDHVFIPEQDASRALDVLLNLASVHKYNWEE